MNTVTKFVSSYQMLDTVPTRTAAIERCWQLAGKSAKEAAWEMGIDYCHFMRMMRDTDPNNFPQNKTVQLMKRMGNTFPLDWEARQLGQVCYPLDFMMVLDGIRDALLSEGRDANFSSLLREIRRRGKRGT